MPPTNPADDHSDTARRGRNDPNRDTGERVDRLHVINTRAIDLTEALLLLSRPDQRSFTRERVDLSLIAEEATETLLPLAEKRGLSIETSGDVTHTIGSHALLLQMATNLVHNRTDHAGVGLGLAIVKSITQAHDGTLTLTPRAAGGRCVTVELPAAPRNWQMTIRNCRTAQALDARNLDAQEDLLRCAALDWNDANDAGPLDQNPRQPAESQDTTSSSSRA